MLSSFFFKIVNWNLTFKFEPTFKINFLHDIIPQCRTLYGPTSDPNIVPDKFLFRIIGIPANLLCVGKVQFFSRSRKIQLKSKIVLEIFTTKYPPKTNFLIRFAEKIRFCVFFMFIPLKVKMSRKIPSCYCHCFARASFLMYVSFPS